METKHTTATYTIPEVARILGVGRMAAYKAAERGDIPSFRIGKLVRVPKSAIDRLLAEGCENERCK